MPAMLKLLPRGTANMPDPHGAEASPMRRRIVGKKHEEIAPGEWAWMPTGKPDELPYHHDLVKAVKEGDLWPADQATADLCGVKFDPTFGSEPLVASPNETTSDAGIEPGKENV